MAEQAAEALRSAGFPARDVALAGGEEVNRRLERDDLADLLAEAGTEEGAFCRSYNEQARAGYILSVYTDGDEQMEHARSILAEHGAHSMKHFGDWTMRELA